MMTASLSLGNVGLLVGLAVATLLPQTPAPNDGATDLPDARTLILTARSRVLDPIAGGGSVHGDLHFAVLPARIPAMHRFSGEFRQDRADTEITLRPTLDQRAPGGKAMAGTQIVVLVESERVTLHVTGRPGFEKYNGPFEYDVPALRGATFALLAPPEEWAAFPYSVKATTIDPHLLLSDERSPWAPVPAAVASERDDERRDDGAVDTGAGSGRGAAVEFFVLTTTENCALSETEEGQVQLWIRRSTGIIERMVVVLRPKESNAGEDTSRAIMTYRNVVIESGAPTTGG